MPYPSNVWITTHFIILHTFFPPLRNLKRILYPTLWQLGNAFFIPLALCRPKDQVQDCGVGRLSGDSDSDSDSDPPESTPTHTPTPGSTTSFDPRPGGPLKQLRPNRGSKRPH